MAIKKLYIYTYGIHLLTNEIGQNYTNWAK